ncbi:MAG: hypothetical protein ABFS12_06280 [Bacteroidota bacterium]
MNIVIPQNIYSALFALVLPDELKKNVVIRESSLTTKEINEGKFDVGLIPSCDLLSHQELYVSKKYAISFDGPLSNTYLYFVPEQHDFKNVLLRGDISSNDLILSKILFSEHYGIEAEFSIDTNLIDLENNNYLISGMENNEYLIAKNGISFSDQFADLIDFPYVNYVLAAKDKDKLEEFTSELGNIDEKITSQLDDFLPKLGIDNKLQSLIKENDKAIYFDLTDNEIEGLNEQLKLPYYHGIIEEIVEVNFV